ncbi:vitellogenin-2-like, partial [Sceloporus undulatus]
VQGILIQIYLNTSNSIQVRIMSCIAIFQTYPALPMVTAIANAAFREKNPVLYSFVYSQLKAWTKTRIPAYYELSSVCNVALKLLNPRFFRLYERYSKVVHFNFFNSIHRFGAIAKLFVIDNPRGPLPSNVMFNTQLIFS